MAFDISGMLGNTGVALEQTAFSKFGAAVANQADTSISSIFATKSNSDPLGDLAAYKAGSPASAAAAIAANANKVGDWNPTAYASALADAKGGYDPKNKFLFKIYFEFYDSLSQIAESLGSPPLASLSRDLSFIIKQIDIPKYDFEYEEVNLYNFRTKVLKKISHQELKFSFYDDTSNHALNFLNSYLMLLVPVSRVARDPNMEFGDFGFAYPQYYGGPDSSMRSALGSGIADSQKQIIRRLTVTQYYLDRQTPGTPLLAYKANTFEFTNPRLVHFDTGDHDHENGNSPAVVNASFDFDTLHISTGIPASQVKGVGEPLNTGDMLSAATPEVIAAGRGSAQMVGNSHNPFVDIIANQGSRMVQQGVGSILGNSPLATIAGGALSPYTSQITSAVGGAAQRTLSTVGAGISQSISAPSSPPVADNSQPSATSTQIPTFVP